MTNNKVLVEIYVPASGECFDVYIPLESRVSEVLRLTAAIITDLSDGVFISNKDTVLCDAETGNVYDVNIAVAELGIKNGSRLMLI